MRFLVFACFAHYPSVGTDVNKIHKKFGFMAVLKMAQIKSEAILDVPISMPDRVSKPKLMWT